MYELEDADHETIRKFATLEQAKDLAKQRWGSNLFFDGNIEFGATEIYIYRDEEDDEVVGYIQVPQE